MGSKSSTQTSNQSSSSTQKTTFDQMSPQERAIMNMYQSLGENQLSQINQILAPGSSPYTMNPGDQEMVNKSFDAAKQRFMTSGKDYADYLATTRGLNKSDTPVSQQAMERFGLGLADLESQQAQAGLNYGLMGTQLRLGATGALPAGLGAAFAPMYNERMAGGRTDMSGNSSGTTTMKYTPSIMDQIGQGMSLGAGAAMMAGGLMMPGMSGLGQIGLGGMVAKG